MAVLIIAADIGAKAFYLLMIWLASAIGASELSKRKGYGEKWGLGTGSVSERRRADHLDPRAGAGGFALAPEAGPQGGCGRSRRPRRGPQVARSGARVGRTLSPWGGQAQGPGLG